MKTERAFSLSEIIAAANRIGDSWQTSAADPQEVWFRGQGRSCQDLSPSLYRRENSGYDDLEQSMMARFESLAAPLAMSSHDPWEWYFLARHHGLPTRLLDWTESLLIATRFALWEYGETLDDRNSLDSARRAPGGESKFDDESPCIWLVEAGSLNRFSIGEDVSVIPGGPLSQPYLPDEIDKSEESGRFPIALLPRRTNPRLTAQRGLFTVHGHDKTPLDVLAMGLSNDPNQDRRMGFPLAQIQLDRARLAHLLHEIDVAGVDRLGLFPDLDHAAQQVCWEYKRTTVIR